MCAEAQIAKLRRLASAADAARATQVAEKWLKGYLRLGQCHLALHNFADSAAAYWKAGELEADEAAKRKHHKKFKAAVQEGKDQNAARVRLLKAQTVLNVPAAVARRRNQKVKGKKKGGKKKKAQKQGTSNSSPATPSTGDSDGSPKKEEIIASPRSISSTVLVWRREQPSGEGPGPRSSHGVSIVGSTLYVYGGELEPRTPVDSVVYACDLDDQPSKRWTVVHLTRGKAPPARIGHAQATVGECFYVFGG